MECWSNVFFAFPLLHYSTTPPLSELARGLITEQIDCL
jgi:hypothetical protein